MEVSKRSRLWPDRTDNRLPAPGCRRVAPGSGRGSRHGRTVAVGLAGVRLEAGTLIRTAARDRSDQEFQVEVVGDELTDELVEQFRMAGWVVHAAEAVQGRSGRRRGSNATGD